MSIEFFEKPILNSPYEYPRRHWELDGTGQPHDPDSYYRERELVPSDLLEDLKKAKIVITNYHAFKMRERMELSKGGRSLLQGRGDELNTLETEGQMLQRVIPDLMAMKNVMVINDEAHHCYREKPRVEEEVDDLSGEEKKEAEKNREAARLWISGIEILNRKIGVNRVFDLSATPFFLSGSGYVEGTFGIQRYCSTSPSDFSIPNGETQAINRNFICSAS